MAYNSSHTGPEIDAAVGAVQEKEAAWDGKQDKVTGIQGQVVGFDQDGDMVAEDKYPQGGEDGQVLTQTSTGPSWQDAPSGLPEGGTTGQILEKTATGTQWADKPASGMSQSDADDRYLQLSGGTMTGDIEFSGGGNISRNYVESTNDITIEQPRTGSRTGYTRVMVSETKIQLLMDHGSGAERFVFTPSGLNMGDLPITNCPSITTSTAQTVTLSSGSWISSSGVYQQTVNVTGVTADTPVIIVNPSLSTTDADANDTILEAWGKIAKLEISQGAGTLTFRATEAISVNVPVKVGVC